MGAREQAAPATAAVDAQRRAAIRTLAVDDQTARVVAALDARGIESLMLKGPAIARRLYGPDEPRFYGDTDLLVAPRARADAEQALVELGYERVYGERTVAVASRHASPWRRPGSALAVDLHHTLAGVRGDPDELWSMLREHTIGLDVQGTPVRALDAAALALHVALHAAHHGSAGEKPQRDLERALQLLHAGQWRAAAGLAARVDALDAFGVGLRLLPAGDALATRLGLAPNRSRDVELRAMDAPTVTLGLERLIATQGAAAKTRQLVRWMFPPQDFMQNRNPLARRGRAGLLLAYGWRVLGLARQCVPAARAWRRASRATRATRATRDERS